MAKLSQAKRKRLKAKEAWRLSKDTIPSHNVANHAAIYEGRNGFRAKVAYGATKMTIQIPMHKRWSNK